MSSLEEVFGEIPVSGLSNCSGWNLYGKVRDDIAFLKTSLSDSSFRYSRLCNFTFPADLQVEIEVVRKSIVFINSGELSRER